MVIARALQALIDQEEAEYREIRELVRAGFESGPSAELTDDLWDEMEREVDEAYQRGDEIVVGRVLHTSQDPTGKVTP